MERNLIHCLIGLVLLLMVALIVKHLEFFVLMGCLGVVLWMLFGVLGKCDDKTL